MVSPYLGATTDTEVVISWVTDRAVPSEVRYRLDQSYSELAPASSEMYDGKYWHSATITSLQDGTTYHYRVYGGGMDLTPWAGTTFTTAPEAAASCFIFVVLGDSRPQGAGSPPSAGARTVAARLREYSFDFGLHTGDIVCSGGICSGGDSSWNQYLRAYFDLYNESIARIPFYLCVGSHELLGGSCGYRGYSDVYHLPLNAPSGHQEQYYSFDWGNAHFVALDSNQSCSPGSGQHNWLLDDLQHSSKLWKFAFFHHPLYSSGSHGSQVALRDHLVPVFEANGVDVVFSGHDHHYERTCPISDGACVTPAEGSVVYYVTGGAGAPLYYVGSSWFTAHSASLHHFLKAEVDGCQLRIEAMDDSGNVFDSWILDRCPP